MAAYTAVMFSLADHLTRRFGPQVRIDLEWRVQRGAQELARTTEIGLVIGDREMVENSFGVYAKSVDVQAIVAVDAQGKLVAQHGQPPQGAAELFAGPAHSLRESNGYLVSWATAEIEGAPVGKVAVVVSLRRLIDAQALLKRSSDITLAGGLAGLLLGAMVVAFFTRAVAQRDAQLSDYAANLERKVDARTRELDERNRGMRLVLDNVAQGFITIGLDGAMASERSAVVDRWFGTPPANTTLGAYLLAHAPTYCQWLEIGLDQLRDGFMPAALLLDQLPKRFSTSDRTYDVVYNALGPADAPERLLVIISDVTALLARERAEVEQRELVALFERISVDRSGVEEFLSEAAGLVGALRTEQDPVVQKRLVHTLKGNCAIYGLESYAELAHTVENELAESGGGLRDAQRSTLVSMWKQAMQRVGFLLGAARRDSFDIDKQELEALVSRVRLGAANAEVAATLVEWTRQPLAQRLERLARQARSLARRLNKPEPHVEVDAHAIRLDPNGWSAYWSAMVHVMRNAVDHGIEDAETRALLGKPEQATLRLTAERRAGQLTITVRDDGRGIDWDQVRTKAAALGLPHREASDLLAALFMDGFTTRDQVSQASGRGVGLGALRETVLALGGRIEVESTLGKGTEFRFKFDEKLALTAARNAPKHLNASLMPLAT